MSYGDLPPWEIPLQAFLTVLLFSASAALQQLDLGSRHLAPCTTTWLCCEASLEGGKTVDCQVGMVPFVALSGPTFSVCVLCRGPNLCVVY